MPDPKVKYNRTRIAPTPSGFLHIGNVLSFAITAALARHTGAKILLRIDDIDQARANKQYVQDIFDTLNFLEIPWNEGPQDVKEFEGKYSQLHRMGLYKDGLNYLQHNKLVYACNCSRKQLSESTCNCYEKQLPLTADNVSWRLITRPDGQLIIKDYNGELIQTSLPAEMNNFVVRKKDGFPAYQLTSVIDDLYFGVDLVVRGQDLWHSTLAQHQLAIALGKHDLKDVTFYQHPLIRDSVGNKLSKSAGAMSVKYLHEQGKSASDVYQLITTITGINEPVYNWEQLAGIIINKH
jgi:glutamyl/glutaminyl-tRNA synthetase